MRRSHFCTASASAGLPPPTRRAGYHRHRREPGGLRREPQISRRASNRPCCLRGGRRAARAGWRDTRHRDPRPGGGACNRRRTGASRRRPRLHPHRAYPHHLVGHQSAGLPSRRPRCLRGFHHRGHRVRGDDRSFHRSGSVAASLCGLRRQAHTLPAAPSGPRFFFRSAYSVSSVVKSVSRQRARPPALLTGAAG